jgi:hypothetical protein
LLTYVGEYARPLLEIIENQDFSTFTEILSCSYFKQLKTKSNTSIEQSIGARCVVCQNRATRKCESTPSYTFCNTVDCIAYMGPLLNIIKSEIL